jgi:haloacetate dehalogenase
MSANQTVQTKRSRLFVRDSGTGFPIVLLHGWPESSYCWEPVVEHFDDGFRLLRPDLRGLGDSERSLDMPAYQKAELAQDVIATLDAMGINEFGLVGHDWGGAVAQEIAIAVPDRVLRLGIMNIHLINNPVGLAAANAAHAARQFRSYWYQYFMHIPKLSDVLIQGHERTFLSVFLRGKPGWTFPSAAVDEYVRCYEIPNTTTTGANYYRAMALDAERWRTLKEHKHRMPTLLLYGEHDPVVIKEFLKGYEHCFDDVRLSFVDASHFAQEEQPEKVGKALNEHFQPLLDA